MPIGFWSVILGAMCVISCGEKQKRSFNAFDTYLQFYQEVNDSLSKNPRYVCAEAQKRMTATTDSTTHYHYVMLFCILPSFFTFLFVIFIITNITYKIQ